VAVIAEGETYLAMGDAARARERAERGLAIHRRAGTPEVELAWGWFLLARALPAGGRGDARARELAVRARDAFAEMHDGAMLERARAWLAAPAARARR
jgi:hypothetical protein